MTPGAPSVSYLTPPPLSSLPQERSQLEFSSRSIVFRDGGTELLRCWGPPERPWVLGVRDEGTRWRVRAWGGAGPAEARAAARSLFSLDHRLGEFYALARREPVLAGTVGRFPGLRLPRDASLYESLVHSVVGQQVSVAAANALKRRLIDAHGGYLTVEGQEVPHLPSPRALARGGPEALRAVGLSRAKSSALVALAARAGSGALEAARFRRGAVDAAVRRLDAEPGVGAWTAENALLRGVGRTDVFIAGDLGIRYALAAYGAVSEPAPEAERRAWAARHYPGWGSYATLYLWRRWVAEGAPRPARRAAGRRAPYARPRRGRARSG